MICNCSDKMLEHLFWDTDRVPEQLRRNYSTLLSREHCIRVTVLKRPVTIQKHADVCLTRDVLKVLVGLVDNGG